MATACIAQVTFNFDRKRQPVVARFDVPHASSDGGAILLKGIDTQLGLTRGLAAGLEDPRQPGKIQHQTLELLRQRVFGIACGYADCNDAARLADDAIHKLLVDRDPIAGAALASQPTLSRFENAVGWRELLRMGHVLADTVIAHHRRRLKGRARRITIDLDPTDDPTHGQQEFAFFNGHYDTTIAFGGAAGNFELNVMLPILAHNILESIRLLASMSRLFADRCVDGITANAERTRQHAESSPSLATPLNRFIGYDEAAKVAKQALDQGKAIRQVVIERGYVEQGKISRERLDEVLDILAMTQPPEG